MGAQKSGRRAASVSNFTRASQLALITALAYGAPVAAHAQATAQQTAEASDIGSIEEVVVTARKRSERLRDIPTAGTALGAEAIREMGGVPTAQALLTTTPGVNFSNTSNPVTSEVSIRGSGTSRATNAEAGVGLYRDGAYIGGGTVGGRTFTELDLFDVERIEVLRGVQGGLAGRNAEGGSINVVSARPSDTFEGFATATIGVKDRAGVQLVSNLPINEHWAVRIGGELMEQRKGFYHFYLLGDRYADQQRKQFLRGQVRYQNGRFNANFLAEHSFQQLPGIVAQITAFPSAAYPTGWSEDRFNVPWDFASQGKQQVNNFELTTNLDLGFAALSTTTMERYRWGQNIYDRDATSLALYKDLIAAGKVAPSAVAKVLAGDYALQGDQGDRARISYQDVHLTGTKVGKFEWLVGAEYFMLHDKPFSVFGKTPTAASPSPGTVDKARLRFESYALYGSAGYDLTSTLNLSGDLRVTRDDETFTSRRLDLATLLPTSSAFAIDGTRSATNVSYTATASYKPTSEMMLYGKVGSAYRAGGFNTSLGDPRQPITPPIDFNDETVTSYEVGYKGNVLPNLYLAAAAYQNRFDNLVIQGDNGCAIGGTVCPVQPTIFAFNAGPAKLWGLEIEATARFDVFDGPLRVTLGASKQGGKITGGIYKGRRQPQQPDYTMTFSTNYRHDLAAGMTGFVNLKGSGRWGGVQEVAQTPPLHDYVIVDARAGVEKGPYEVAAYVENLFDKSYIVFDSITAAAATTRYNIPRTYGVQLRYTW